MSRLYRQWISTGLLSICILAGAGLSLLWTPSAQADLPPRPTVTVRPTSTATSSPTATVRATPEPRPKDPVATLILYIRPSPSGLWSVVQWQDTQGDWHDVEGWRGTVVNGKTVWWVEEKDFGTGPFRWTIYAEGDGALVAITRSFYLPDQPQHELIVDVPLILNDPLQ